MTPCSGIGLRCRRVACMAERPTATRALGRIPTSPFWNSNCCRALCRCSSKEWRCGCVAKLRNAAASPEVRNPAENGTPLRNADVTFQWTSFAPLGRITPLSRLENPREEYLGPFKRGTEVLRPGIGECSGHETPPPSERFCHLLQDITTVRNTRSLYHGINYVL